MVMGEATIDTDVAVIGAGPGGYAAAFRAADLGLDVTMIDADERIGGVCLLRGCIPSKALLHVTELLHDARRAGEFGLYFDEPQIDLEKIRQWKNQIVDRMVNGLVTLSKQREVQIIQGRASFEGSDRLRVRGKSTTHVKFKHAILATGSRAIALPGTNFEKTGRVMSSTGALALPDIPETLLVIGAGYVGMELGSVYASLGSRVTVVEMMGEILPGTDRDLVRPLERRTAELFEAVYLNTKVAEMVDRDGQVEVVLEGDVPEARQSFERVLVAIGRRPNTEDIGLERTGVELDERGYVKVDEQQRTADERILAIGDVVGGMMLAHKAMHEGKVAAEVIAGLPAAFDAQAIPAVVYTDPQIAWAGLMENEAREKGIEVQVSRFPWRISGRALTMSAPEGVTKMVFDPRTERILGVGIVGREAEDLIGEGVLAIEMGALASDVSLSIHPHPTLTETTEEAAGVFLGDATHILSPRKATAKK
jgi:dihydrolipoamide dehydrogenase